MTNYMPTSVVPFQECFKLASARYDVPLSLLLAVARGESNFNAEAESKSLAIGVMQIQWPGTAKHLGILEKSKLFDPCINILAGSRYLSELYNKYGGWHYTLAAYNYGPTRIKLSTNLPEGAEWYSRYIQDHLHDILLEDKLFTNDDMEVLIKFDQHYRAIGYVNWMQKKFPQQKFSWFNLGRGMHRYVVVREMKVSDDSKWNVQEYSRSPAF